MDDKQFFLNRAEHNEQQHNESEEKGTRECAREE